MKISVSSYSFSQYLNDDRLNLFGAVEEAAKMGFDAIEFTDIPGETHGERLKTAEALKDKAKECGIEINAYTVSANLYHDSDEENDNEVERLKKALDVAKVLGASVMRHDACWKLEKSGNARSFDLMLPTIAKNARKISEYAKILGIKTCTENHGYIAQDSDRMERLFNTVAYDNYGLLVDMGNFACADEDSCHAVSKLAPYAFHVHAKDFLKFESEEAAGGKGGFPTRGMNYLVGTSVGYGDIPVEKCIKILKNAGYDGYISIEYEGSEDCIEGIKKGFDKLKSYLNEK